MKKIVAAFSLLGCLVLPTACTLEASFESDGYRSRLSVNTNGNNPDGSISLGGYLTIKIVGEDHDGISHIDVRIPTINVDQEFVNVSNNERWEINQTFNIDTINYDAPHKIYVTLTDKDGVEHSRAFNLKIEVNSLVAANNL
ncbi:hypothetical protein [Flagellimonas pacifica]|uniref:DUF4625 domain-containing protein n=1 Tax=Flagellimonas pacifica TaxID=1247520 RepID=A0A285N1A5_9FLAO|nr:hypothetical protein [Allomuricauda parva]SNZ01786.1 hypothetical protein SAMN06265377_3633 [Allomuricauda parva]